MIANNNPSRVNYLNYKRRKIIGKCCESIVIANYLAIKEVSKPSHCSTVYNVYHPCVLMIQQFRRYNEFNEKNLKLQSKACLSMNDIYCADADELGVLFERVGQIGCGQAIDKQGMFHVKHGIRETKFL